MPNITLSVDEETIKKVRKIAVDRNTTLTAMIREFLTDVANRDAHEKQQAIETLEETFRTLSRDMGERTWTREMLYDR